MLTVHPIGPVTGRAQVLVAKQDEWRLQLNNDGVVEWHVHLAGGWTVATGIRQLSNEPGSAYVIKATHSGGHIKVFTCMLAADFSCPLSVAEGQASGRLPLQTATPPADVYFAAEDLGTAAHSKPGNGFVGAIEEISLWRLSLENVTAHLFSCPACDCVNFYIFDYTKAATRAWWANATANIFNSFGASTAQ